MRKTSLTFVILLVGSLSLLAQQKPARVLVFGLDGFSTEGFKISKHPNIDQLLKDGVLSLTTRPVMPSVTMPNWTSHFTGSGPEEHGVINNAWTLQNHTLLPLVTDKEGYYPSIFQVLKERLPLVQIAYYYNWKELIYPINQKYLDEVAFEEQDGFRGNHQKAFDFIVKNAQKPTLVFLYDVHTDHAGHEFGWMTPQYITAIEEADVAIGETMAKLKSAGLYDSTHFMLITDHGGINKGHGGVTMNEMQIPWGIVGPQIKKRGLITVFNSNKNTSLVLAKIFGLDQLPESWTGILPKAIFR